MYHDALHMRYEIACLASAWLAYAFLARVLRTARARLDRVLSKMGQASLRSYKWGSISGTARYPSEPTCRQGEARVFLHNSSSGPFSQTWGAAAA